MPVTIGIDLGQTTARAVALRIGRGAPRVLATASAARRGDDGEPRPVSEVVAELRRRLPRGRVVVADSSVGALIRFIATVPLPSDRLVRLLRLELSQHLEPDAELAADAVTVAIPGDEIMHCAVAAQAPEVHLLLKELQRAKVVPAAVSHAPAALFNAGLLVPPPGEDDGRLTLLVDIGWRGTGVVLCGHERFLACRHIGFGGEQFTAALAGEQGDLKAAEAAKVAGTYVRQDRGEEHHDELFLDGAAPPAAPVPAPVAATAPAPPSGAAPAIDDPFGGDGQLDLAAPPQPSPTPPPQVPPADLPAIAVFDGDEHPTLPEPGKSTMSMGRLSMGPELTRAAEALYTQLATTLAFFRAQLRQPQLQVGRVVLCGGGAGLLGLDQYLSRRFGVDVERWDPKAGLIGTLPGHAWEWAAAVALALGPAPAGIDLDLRPDRMLLAESWRRRLLWPWVAAAALLAACLLVGWTVWAKAAADEESAVRLLAAAEDEKKLRVELAEQEKRQAELGDDLRAVAARLYAGRDLLYAVRALKEQTQNSKELWVTRLETVAVASDRPTPGASGRSGAAKPKHADSLIERGAVDISGQVKFDAARTDTRLNEFFKNYQQALERWSPGIGLPTLFKKSEVVRFAIDHDDSTAKNPTSGRFTFTLRYFFQDTRLDQVTRAASGGSATGAAGGGR